MQFLKCNNFQFVFCEDVDIERVKSILEETKKVDFRSIELVVKYSKKVIDFMKEIDKYNFRVTKLILHDTQEEVFFETRTTFKIDYINKLISSFTNCGVVDSKYFNVNNNKILESVEYNSCLNKKISVDKHGDIRNCPFMPIKYGNIVENSLIEAIEKQGFKEFWNVPKTKISVFKDCEYKFICTDCRAFTEMPDDNFSKPLKCGYDSYTNKRGDWSTNPLKRKTMEFYQTKKINNDICQTLNFCLYR